MPISPGAAHRVGVVDDAFECSGHGFEPSVWVLREARNTISMVHPVGRRGVKVGSVASSRSAHEFVAGRVEVLVVDAEEKGVEGPEGEAQSLNARDQTLHHYLLIAIRGGEECASRSRSEAPKLLWNCAEASLPGFYGAFFAPHQANPPVAFFFLVLLFFSGYMLSTN